jgi:hypothetical protein
MLELIMAGAALALAPLAAAQETVRIGVVQPMTGRWPTTSTSTSTR